MVIDLDTIFVTRFSTKVTECGQNWMLCLNVFVRFYRASPGSVNILGWGLLSRIPPFRYFLNFAALSKHTLAIIYHVYIWQVSPQLSCGDTWQIWMWFYESNMYFCHIDNFAYGEINERSFSNPHPRTGTFSVRYALYPTVSHWLAMHRKISKIRRTKSQNFKSFSSRPAFVFAQSMEARC